MQMGVMEKGWWLVVRLQLVCAARLRAVSTRLNAQSTVEYALVGALVVIAAAGALTLLGSEVTSVFSRISNTLSGAASAAP
jgi:Flp pilus assembly pilin Flp